MERIRVVRDLMPETRLGFITPGMRFMAWWRAPADVMRLALACVIRSGVRRIWVAESMNDVATDLAIAQIVRDAGAEEVVVGHVYSDRPRPHRRLLRRACARHRREPSRRHFMS